MKIPLINPAPQKYVVKKGIFKGHIFRGTPIIISGEKRIWDDDSTGRAYPSVSVSKLRERKKALAKMKKNYIKKEVNPFLTSVKNPCGTVKSVVQRPASRRGISHLSKESSMAVHSLLRSFKRAKRARKVSHRRRHAAKKVSVVVRSNPLFGQHRPSLTYGPFGWRRPLTKKGKIRSRLMKGKGAVRVNPKGRYYSRRNPGLPFAIDKMAIGGAKVACGLVAGFMLMPLVCKFAPLTMTAKYRRFYGVLNVVVGAVAAATIKNQHVKDAALIVAGTGIYDLIASNIGALGLPPLPSTKVLLGGYDMTPAVGASYQEVGSSYQVGNDPGVVGDSIVYGGDEDMEID
jgi:hypothetical protein